MVIFFLFQKPQSKCVGLFMFSYALCNTVTASSSLQSADAEGGREEESQTCVGQTPRYFGAPEQEQLITLFDTSVIIFNR